jgi:hypothetical protein
MLASGRMTFSRIVYGMIQPSRRPFVRLTLYYTTLGLIAVGVNSLFPGSVVRRLSSAPSNQFFATRGNVIENIEAANEVTTVLMSSADLLFSLTMVVLLMLPVSWVYMATRIKTGIDQSVVQTMILLPVAVTGVVAMVQHSIALAFSLAGIVAAVRFRNTLKRTSDALYIFTAIGVGLAAGIGNLGIGIVLSMFFNVTILILWECDYGVCPKGGPVAEYSSGRLLEAVGEMPVDITEGAKKKSKKKKMKMKPDPEPQVAKEQ